MEIQRKCNKCGYKGLLSFFVKDKNYRYGHRPLCLKCKKKESQDFRDSRVVTKTKVKKRVKYSRPVKDMVLTNEGIQLLIEYGYAKNTEEAIKYVNNV